MKSLKKKTLTKNEETPLLPYNVPPEAKKSMTKITKDMKPSAKTFPKYQKTQIQTANRVTKKK